MKRLLAAVLCVTLALSITACASGGGSESGDGGFKFGGMKSPQNINYTVLNPIEIHTIDRYSDEGYTDEELEKYNGLIYISGLKDEEVQNAINDKIKETFETLRDSGIPAYRGIKARLGEEPEPGMNDWSAYGYFDMSCYASANYNNILSVTITKNSQYKDPNQDYNAYVRQMEPITFDLNSGKVLTLDDVFCDDVDAASYLTDYVYYEILDNDLYEEKDWSWDYPDIDLISEYKGISSDMKFYLASEYNPGIYLIFDENTPEFRTGWDDFAYGEMFVPFSPDMAFCTRYYNAYANDIYVSDEERTRTLISATGKADVASESAEFYGTDDRSGIWAENDAYYYDGISDDMKAYLEKKYFQDLESMAKELKPDYDALYEDYGDDIEVYANARNALITRSYGGYVSIDGTTSRYVEAWFPDRDYDAWKTVRGDYNSFYDTYKAGSTESMKIEDFFVEGADTKALIADAIEAHISYMYETYGTEYKLADFGHGATADKDKEYCRWIADNIDSWAVEQQYFAFEIDREAATKKIYELYFKPEEKAVDDDEDLDEATRDGAPAVKPSANDVDSPTPIPLKPSKGGNLVTDEDVYEVSEEDFEVPDDMWYLLSSNIIEYTYLGYDNLVIFDEK